AAHGDVVRRDLDDLLVRHGTARRLAFAPEEGHTKERAAGTARETGIGFGHLGSNSKAGGNRHMAIILCLAPALEKPRLQRFTGARPRVEWRLFQLLPEPRHMALPTLRIIGFIIGIFLITLAVSMLIPMLTLLVFNHPEDLKAFFWSSLVTLFCGLALVVPGRPENAKLRPRDMYLLTTCSWLVVCLFAAMPMMLLHHITFTDAFFETMSGVTTTGSTVLTDLDNASPALLIWRSMLQWLGGIGFIAMAVAILPLLRVGGMRLFQTESSDWGEKVMPRSHMAAKYIIFIYLS